MMGNRIHSSACRTCGTIYLETASRVAKGDFQCLPCRREAQVQWRLRRKADGNPVVTPKMGRDYHLAYDAEYSQRPEVRKRRADLAKKYASDPELRHKHEARWKTRRAIASGALSRGSCEVCGAEKVDAHHDDYSQPINVRWLCRPHHRELHAKARGEAP